jgi:hypothetical protein
LLSLTVMASMIREVSSCAIDSDCGSFTCASKVIVSRASRKPGLHPAWFADGPTRDR